MQLVPSPSKQVTIQELFSRDIFPPPQALSQMVSGFNVWDNLASANNNISQNLLENNIFPDQVTLKRLSNLSNPNTTFKNLFSLITNYNLPVDNQMTAFLARNNNDFYSFLYLVYSVFNKNLSSEFTVLYTVPLEIWLLLGTHILENVVPKNLARLLQNEKNKEIFVKHYLINRFNDYLKDEENSLLGLFTCHKERVDSLISAMKNDHESSSQIITKQYFMSKQGKYSPYKSPKFKYQSFFYKDIRKEIFGGQSLYDILAEGALLSRKICK